MRLLGCVLLVSAALSVAFPVSRVSFPIPNITSHTVVTADGVKLYTQLWLIEDWLAKDDVEKQHDNARTDHNFGAEKSQKAIRKRATVLLRSPYPRAEQDVALPWLEQGYAVVLQDMRGMEYSTGTFDFFRHGSADAADTMAWIAKQDFSNGNVFGFGISADGINCYTEQLAQPTQLKAQFPIWASGEGWPTAYQGGALREELVVAWLNTIQRGSFVNVVKEQEIYSSWWEPVSLDDKFPLIQKPAVHWVGWFDIFQQLQLDAFHGYQYESALEARGKSFVVVTPHGHCAWATDVPWFPDSETTLPADLASALFRSVDTPVASASSSVHAASVFGLVDSVNFYVMAPREAAANPEKVGNYWTSLPAFPTPKTTPLFLWPGNLLAQQKPSLPSYNFSYTYDPDFPVPTWGGNNLFNTCGPRNQKDVNARSDVVVFSTEALGVDTAITGRVTANLFVSSDGRDTDFTVKLLDMYPQAAESQQVLVVDGIIRMKFRQGNDKVVPMEPGQVYNVSVDLWSTSWIFPKGHRIGIAISSSNYPRFQAHINQFAPITDWDNLDSRNAQNAIYVGAMYPSSIILPMIDVSQIPKNPNITGTAEPKTPDQIRMLHERFDERAGMTWKRS